MNNKIGKVREQLERLTKYEGIMFAFLIILSSRLFAGLTFSFFLINKFWFYRQFLLTKLKFLSF